MFFHDPDAGDARTIDVGARGPRLRRATSSQYEREERGEDLRLAYVALTRARHQAIVWWAGSYDSRDSPLGRLLFARDEHGNVAAQGGATPADAGGRQRASRSWPSAARRARIGVERSTARAAGRLAAAARADRPSWRVARSTASSTCAGGAPPTATSPPAATRRGSPASPRSRLGRRARSRAAAAAPAARRADGRGRRRAIGPPSLLAAMPVGVRGRHVRAPGAGGDRLRRRRPRGRAGRAIAEVQRRRAVDIGDPAAVVAGLRAVIETPLGPLLGGRRLRDVAAPTGSTSSASSCRWPAATSRRAR